MDTEEDIKEMRGRPINRSKNAAKKDSQQLFGARVWKRKAEDRGMSVMSKRDCEEL